MASEYTMCLCLSRYFHYLLDTFLLRKACLQSREPVKGMEQLCVPGRIQYVSHTTSILLSAARLKFEKLQQIILCFILQSCVGRCYQLNPRIFRINCDQRMKYTGSAVTPHRPDPSHTTLTCPPEFESLTTYLVCT